MRFSLQHRSESHWAELQSKLGELQLLRVRAGVFSGHSVRGVPLVDIAAYNELGTSTSPARSFIASTMRERRAQAAEVLKTATVEALAGHLREAQERVGRWMVDAIRAKIQAGDFAPLAISTARRKGHSQPLIYTGRLLAAVSYQVVS